MRLTSTVGLQPLVDYTIEETDDLVEDPDNEGFTLGGFLQGQGSTLRAFHVNFGTASWGGDDGKNAPNSYMPRSPNKTGGNWAYMGISFPVSKIEITDAYAIGLYGGVFQHSDGKLVSEKDYPQLQAISHIHEHSRDKGWIKYTDRSNTWRDRMSIMRTNPDGQHACQVSVLAQLAERYPEDEGLQMLLEECSHVYTRQFPFQARGTTHNNPGQERAQGRVMKSGVDAFMGSVNIDDATALRYGHRVLERFTNDKKQFLSNYAKHGVGWSQFARFGAYSTNEIGIHYWGMDRLHDALDKLGVDHLEEVHFWMREASRWCFDSFRFYDIAGHRHWGYPYYEDKDHKDLSGPVSAEHFGWLAAVSHEPQNPTEWEKHKALLELGAGMDPRFVS